MRGAGATESVPGPEEPRKVPCAAKLAESEWLPALKAPMLKVAEPLERAIADAPPPSTLSDTLPVTVPPEAPTETITLAGVP